MIRYSSETNFRYTVSSLSSFDVLAYIAHDLYSRQAELERPQYSLVKEDRTAQPPVHDAKISHNANRDPTSGNSFVGRQLGLCDFCRQGTSKIEP